MILVFLILQKNIGTGNYEVLNTTGIPQNVLVSSDKWSAIKEAYGLYALGSISLYFVGDLDTPIIFASAVQINPTTGRPFGK